MRGSLTQRILICGLFYKDILFLLFSLLMVERMKMKEMSGLAALVLYGAFYQILYAQGKVLAS